MRTERAPTTALSGNNISEVSLAISTAILATPYAVFQLDSLDDPGSFGVESAGSQLSEVMENAMALVEATSAFGFPTRVGRIVASSCLMCSTIGDGGGLSVGLAGGGVFFRRRGMEEDNKCGSRSGTGPREHSFKRRET
jgi:hypothetical protein